MTDKEAADALTELEEGGDDPLEAQWTFLLMAQEAGAAAREFTEGEERRKMERAEIMIRKAQEYLDAVGIRRQTALIERRQDQQWEEDTVHPWQELQEDYDMPSAGGSTESTSVTPKTKTKRGYLSKAAASKKK